MVVVVLFFFACCGVTTGEREQDRTAVFIATAIPTILLLAKDGENEKC